MSLIDKMQSIELSLERRHDHVPSLGDRILRKLLSISLRSIGVERGNPIVTSFVHGAELKLRNSHALPDIVRAYPCYDTALPVFIRRIHDQLGAVVRIIDVGANIGDTAKIIACVVGPSNVHFLCVEGDPDNIPLLRDNLTGLSASIIAALAGSATATAGVTFVRDHGTTRIVLGDGAAVPIIRLDEVVGAEPFHVVKIDTDGFELKVLHGLSNVLARDSPYLFIEVSPTHWRMIGKDEPMKAIGFLKDSGYNECLVYDNTGYPVSVGSLAGEHIEHLINYASAKPKFYFDFLISKIPGSLRDFYHSEVNRVGVSNELF